MTPEVPTVSEPGQQEPAAIVEAEATPKVEEKSKAAEESKPETTEGPVKVRIELPNPVEEDLFKIE